MRWSVASRDATACVVSSLLSPSSASCPCREVTSSCVGRGEAKGGRKGGREEKGLGASSVGRVRREARGGRWCRRAQERKRSLLFPAGRRPLPAGRRPLPAGRRPLLAGRQPVPADHCE
eukprot:157831-Chlamydomonas_euryale.AAC.1